MQCCTERPPPSTSNTRLCQRLLDTHGQVWIRLVGSLLLSPGSWCVLGFVCVLQESVSPVLCKFWRLYGRVNGDLLLEGLCHTQVCSRSLLTCTSVGDTQTQLWLSLCGFSGSWSAQGLFEPSNSFWWVWGLILNVILPLRRSCCGFSFAPGHGISFLVGSNILLSMVVQQQVVIVEFLHENMSIRPSTLPSSSAFTYHYLMDGVF